MHLTVGLARGVYEKSHTTDNKSNNKKPTETYVKTKNKVVDPTRSVAAVDTGMYLVGLNLFPALLGIL